ncbi:MAG: bifunctional [glutamine synthetase] adenylyltransferase/[glutamine synthetase]-adenylyl-L-tyrosine phosphorylase, partial [Hyphomicrobiaceae bacterium]|nr:bifunctional [glutamine synthetase] adenylyltransferase/[glutamine synthetase]-adenylyl-L-tyrosine phosphorylase [Hyphomicrobiaceae bacterium]
MADSQAFADFAETMAKKGAEALVEALRADPQACDLLERVLAASPYLSDLAVRHPQALKTFLLADPLPRLEAARQVLKQDVLAADSDAAAMRLLRLFKQELALGVALGDLSGRLSVDLATAVLSEGAEAAIQAAAARALAGEAALGRYHPEDPADPEKGSGYIVLAMGKLGARELNYSSDIDLIVFFDGAKARLKEGLEASPFFVRLTQKVVKLLQERTADGYVFRTDLRLRPDPGATAVAVNIDSALTYYESLGRTWERAAMIKARAVAGDLAAGEAVLAQIAPFVWRRYLDYAAIADIHAIKRSINTHKGFGTITVPGHDLKLGRGGIREIEFFVQTQQLIAGGRNRSLRHRSTVVMLDRFAEGGWIAPETAEALKEDYRFLRRVEHAVQMLRDEQTHRMPHDEEGRRAVATLLGETDPAAFEQRLAATMQRVHGHFTRLFERGEAQEDGLDLEAEEVGPEVLQRIAEFGFQQPVEVVRSFKGLFAGNCNATRVAKSRDRLRALVPALLKAFGATDHPDQAMAAFERFVRGLPAGVQL